MALRPDQSRYGAQGRTGEAVAVDQGLRSYMLRVYNYMGSALLLSGLVAGGVASSDQLMAAIYGTPLQWVIMLAPLGMVFFLSARIEKMSLFTAQLTFWIFAALMGASLSYILRVYTGESVVRVFLYTATAFGALSIFGYTTKKDLSGMGTFLFIGLIGIVIASIVNLFLQSSGMQWVISVIGVLVFAGLTAYDTQKIKEMYRHADGTAVAGKKAIMGALRLYLDFLNMFLFLLHIFGGRD
jgi:FtsH-binding integral membrane protein